MSTPSPTPSSPPSDSNPNSAASPPHQNQPALPPPRNITVVALAASTSAVARKTQPVLWTNDETLLLIDSYKEKWYSIGRGPLKSSHWEEMSVAVSARSGVDRSSTQCRHKIEKLRKRFRSERESMGSLSIWPFYSHMEELYGNTAPISARPLTRLPPKPNHYDVEEEDEEEEEEEEEERRKKSRSINYIIRRPGSVNRFAGEKRKRKRKRKGGGGEGARALAYEIKAFAERVMVMEKKKMEFAKETVKMRREMEIQRLQLIQNSQSQLLQFLHTAFDSSF